MTPIPPTWVWVKLSNITNNIQKVNPKLEPNKEFQYLEINSIDNTRQLILEAKNYIGKDAPSRARQLVKTNDILFSTVRTYLKNIAIVNDKFNNQVASTGFCVIRSKQPILSKYLYYYFQTSQFLNPLNEIQRGTSYPAVRNSDVLEQYIPLPPLIEQGRIVDKLEEIFTRIDNCEERLNKAQTQINHCRISIIDESFEYLYSLHKDNLFRIEDISLKVTDGEHLKPKYVKNGIPFLTAKNVREEGIEFNDVDYISNEDALKSWKRCNPEKGDIVIVSRGATIGRSCIIDTDKKFCLLGSVILIKLKNEINNEYLNYILKSTKIKLRLLSMSGSTAQQAIYLRNIKDLIIPVPSLTIQNDIVKNLNYKISILDNNIKLIPILFTHLNILKLSILKNAFKGDLIPQSSSDEPANILIERIRREE